MNPVFFSTDEDKSLKFAYALIQGDFPQEWHTANPDQVRAIKAFDYQKYFGMGSATWMTTNEVSEEHEGFTVFMEQNGQLHICRSPNGYKRMVTLVPEHLGIGH